MSDKVTTEQVHELTEGECRAMLQYLVGWFHDDDKAQDGLAHAYAAIIRERAYNDPDGRRLMQAIIDRKAARGA